MRSVDRQSESEAAILETAHVARRYLYGLGMPGPALATLERLLTDATSDAVRSDIAWLLLEWYVRRNTEEVRDLEPLFALAAWPPDDGDRIRRATIARSRWIGKSNPDAAVALLEAQLQVSPHADLMLALANLGPLEAKVDWLNRALALDDLTPVALADASAAPFDRLRPIDHQPIADADAPLVTVIVPVFNAADTVGTALASLGWQRWTNLEIIVVDDASSDDSLAVIEAAARTDPRIRVIASEENAGAYVARNRGLAEASGAFVTVHDADDWSHPEKIAFQVEHLLANPAVPANMTMKVRAHPTLDFVGLHPLGSHVAPNASSLMFRREMAIAELGSWDSVRVGADTEFIRRLGARFGPDAVVTLASGPLSLQRRSSGSLTGLGALAYPGFEFGARKEYGEHGYWFLKRHPDRLRFPFPMVQRPYPAPSAMLPDRAPGATRFFDVVIASDFRQRSDANIANLEEIEANAALGLTTGLVQMSAYDLEAERRRHPWLADAIEGGHAEMLVFGERIETDLLVVRDPRVLAEEQAYLPDIKAGAVRIVAAGPPLDKRFDAARLQYDAKTCDRYAERLFGARPLWHPTNPLVRAALVAQGVDEAVLLSGEDWPELVTLPGLENRPERAAGKQLRVGRHGPDHWSAWPANAEEIRAAYPDEKGSRVALLGSTDAVTGILGALPANWKAGNAKRRNQIGAFLSRLDAYVWITRQGIPQFEHRNVLEAMAAGIPLVLGTDMAELFVGFAHFSRPEGVRRALKTIASDPGATERIVSAARDFVGNVHGRQAYAARLKPWVGRLRDSPMP